MRAESLDFAGYHVARDDTAGFAVYDDQVEHLVTRVAFHAAFGDLAVQRGVSAEQQLLSGLAAGVKRTRNLRAAERTVVEQSAVIAGERNALCDALVDDMIRYLGQTVYVGFAGAVVAALDRIVKKTVYRVVVVLVVLGGVDASLRGDAVRAARGVADSEYLYVISEFAERSGCGCAAQSGTHYDNVEFSLIGGADHFDFSLMLAPFVGQRALRSFRF